MTGTMPKEHQRTTISLEWPLWDVRKGILIGKQSLIMCIAFIQLACLQMTGTVETSTHNTQTGR